MAVRKPYLSKTRLISAWQCPKRLYLEKHHPELAVISAQTESQFATGHDVGSVAKQLYGTQDSVEIAFDFKTMIPETRRLLESGADFPIFEATFRYENVLVRVDVLLPDGDGWRVVEVKASTSVKDYHVLDCAIQDWVLRNSGLPVTAIALAHVDNQFVYPGDGDYRGLLVEHDLTGEIRTVEPRVEDLVAAARDAVGGPEPLVTVGPQCSYPYECPFITTCWPTDTRYPVMGLGGSKAKLGQYVAAGNRDICDVDPADITAESQLRIHRVTCSGQPEVLDGARRELSALAYPRYFLDFETVAPAVPIWPGTRPYQTIPVQFSCHVDDGSGGGSAAGMRHEEFLDLSGSPPMRALAEDLIDCLGETGPVLMYTNYEQLVIENLAEMFPDLADPLHKIVARLFDLHPVVKNNYYHPDMLGSWSIKAVLPTINPDMDYAKLEGIREGGAASDGFLEAIGAGRWSRPENTPTEAHRSELREQLLRYCRFDTEAMVEIVHFFTRT